MPSTPATELTAADVSLLREERAASAHMHVGGVSVFAGPPPPIGELRAHVLRRLCRVPRYRKLLVTPPLGLGRPHWAIDPDFRIDAHVRHMALPSPGDENELRIAAARLFSQRLDRRRPLWELWVVEGLAGDRFAIVTKSHQALVDGIVAVDLMTALLDAEPDAPGDDEDQGRWLAPPLPSPAQLVASATLQAGRTVAAAPVRVAGVLTRPVEAAARAVAGADRLAPIMAARLRPAPASPLNVPIGPHRRVARTAVPVAEMKRVKDTFGGTVNDVVLAVVAGGVRHWMRERGLHTSDLELRAAVPIAVEATPGEPRPIAMLYAPLPIGEPDPLARFERIRRSMSASIAGHDVVGASTLTSGEEFAPPSVLAQASRLRMDGRRFNLLVTNVPGAQTPMYLLGRRMETTVPIPFLSGDRALAVAVTSYAGTAEFGLLGDLDKLADIDTVAEGLRRSMAELLTLARRGRSARRVRRAGPPVR
jgi:WS/DGAT/MGAT family acyltransferase